MYSEIKRNAMLSSNKQWTLFIFTNNTYFIVTPKPKLNVIKKMSIYTILKKTRRKGNTHIIIWHLSCRQCFSLLFFNNKIARTFQRSSKWLSTPMRNNFIIFAIAHIDSVVRSHFSCFVAVLFSPSAAFTMKNNKTFCSQSF